MKKIFVSLLLCIPMIGFAQTTLTPQQELEKAQRQLEEAKAALEKAKQAAAQAKQAAEAKAKAEADAKAKANAEAAAKAEQIRRQIEATKAETERLNKEAQAISDNPATYTKENGWTAPANPAKPAPVTTNIKTASNNADRYLSPEAVPEVNGKVQWSETFNVPGASATELYNKTLNFLNLLTQEKNQLPESKVILVNENEHSIIAAIHEKLIFTSTFISLDYTKFNYALEARCTDGTVTLTMSRLTYNYTVQDDTSNFTAENWISNKKAVNKKGTRLYPISGKFRRATIDRKDQIFQGLMNALQGGNVTISRR